MFKIKALSFALLVTAFPFSIFAAPPASNLIEQEITLNPESGIASGATRMGGQFSLMGIEGVGLFVGNPNTLARADRVVMTFDLASLLRNAAKIKSAKLVFYSDYFFGPDDPRELELVVFDAALSELTEESLSSSEIQPVAKISVTSADQTKGGQAAGNPYEVDVTTSLLNKLKTGALGISFRLQDVKVEEEGNPSMEAAGITLDKRPDFLPKLVVQREP